MVTLSWKIKEEAEQEAQRSDLIDLRYFYERKKREQISVTLIILLKLNFNSYIPSAILFLKVCFFNVCVPLDTCWDWWLLVLFPNRVDQCFGSFILLWSALVSVGNVIEKLVSADDSEIFFLCVALYSNWFACNKIQILWAFWVIFLWISEFDLPSKSFFF